MKPSVADQIMAWLSQVIQNTLSGISSVLCISGHSLGAGAAVILTAILRPVYPNVKCYSYCPPGGLCSAPMAKATKVINYFLSQCHVIQCFNFRVLCFLSSSGMT